MGAKLDYSRGRWIALLALVWLLVPTHVFAGTTGNLTGYVTNQKGEPIGNARVTLTSSSLQGAQTATSDDQGFYRVFALPPGTYAAVVEGPGYLKTKRENIVLLVDQTLRADIALTKIGADNVEGDVIVITEQAPIVEQGSTTVGANLSGEFLQQVPTGRRLTTILQLTPGATGDLLGTSFLGASSPENAIVIDGLNTTGIDYGLASTNLPIEFIDQVEVKTAGYGAEYGRSTGAFINTILKSGGNEFHGDVFVYLNPPVQGVPEPAVYAANGGDAVYRTDVTELDMDIGFDVGGALIKDKLWFFAGFMPRVRNETITREMGDEERVYDSSTFTGYYVGKLTYQLNEKNNMVLTILGNPTSYSGPAGSTASIMRGQEATYMFKSWLISQMDASLRWNSKLKNDTINVEFLLGHHRETEIQTPYGERDADNPFSGTEGYGQYNRFQSVYEVGADPGISELGTSYDAPDCGGRPCYVYNYTEGGFGFVEEAVRTRTTATLKTTHYLNNLMGNHKFLWGGDFEFLQFANNRAYTSTHLSRYTSYLRERYFATGADDAAGCADKWPEGAYGDVLHDSVPVYYYDDDGNQLQDGVACLLHYFPATTNNLNASAFVQESWSILDNLTLNLGLRWEMQQLRAPRTAAGDLGLVNLGIYNNWAPRLGFIFDPTNEGRSKIFGSFGRYFESIPMDINDRAFSFEGLAYYYKDYDGNPLNMLQNFGLSYYPNPLTLGGHTTPIEVGLKSQYHDEFLLGVEYELAQNLAVSARYYDRRLGSIIEDISPDDGNNYIIANPGPPKDGGTQYYDPETDLVFAEYRVDRTDDTKCEVVYLDEAGTETDVLGGLDCFPTGTRAYQGLEMSARKNFSDGWTMMASYMLSWTYGNYPGLFTPENGQLDPNITSQFDLPSLLSNRTGFLPQDVRHNMKLHGAYNWDFGLRTGLGMFIQSGTPYSHLGAHDLYGEGEAFLSPRGTAGRTPARASVDGNIEYFLPLGEQRSLSFQVEAFNMFNFQNATRVDQNYTFASAYNPAEGQSVNQALCTYDSGFDSDGVIDRSDGQVAYCSEMANSNFGQPIAYQSPFSLRLGVKFSF